MGTRRDVKILRVVRTTARIKGVIQEEEKHPCTCTDRKASGERSQGSGIPVFSNNQVYLEDSKSSNLHHLDHLFGVCKDRLI